MLLLFATALCLASTGALLVAERAAASGRDVERARRTAKLVASAGFVVVALAGGVGRYGRWIAGALAFGALGDAALLGRRRRAFVVGMALFALDHVGVVRAAALVVGPGDWPLAWGLLPVAIAGIVVARLWPVLGLLRIPVALYSALIAVTVTAACAPLVAGAPPWFGPRRAALLAAGALCFFVSDLAVARQRFARESFWNKAWGLPLYFGGQLLIAWSAAA